MTRDACVPLPNIGVVEGGLHGEPFRRTKAACRNQSSKSKFEFDVGSIFDAVSPVTQALPTLRATNYRTGERAREQLLEAAGPVFAERGYDRATSREICEVAGMNAAAVNYHFGGFDGLYVETLRRAHRGIVTVEAVRRIVESDLSPRDKLLAYLGPVVRRLADPAARPWHMRLVCREMISPSGLREHVVASEVQPKTDYVRGMIADLIGAGYDEPVVGQAVLTVIAPILIMATAALPILETLAPSEEEAAARAEALSAHYERFVLGGLEATAKAYRAGRAGRTAPSGSGRETVPPGGGSARKSRGRSQPRTPSREG